MLFSMGGIKKALHLSIYFAWFVSTWWHWCDIFNISPLEDRILVVKCLVKCTKQCGYYSSGPAPKQSHDGSCMTGYHDYWRHFSIHLCCSNAPTLPWSNLLSFPLPFFHPSLLATAIQQSFAQRREEKVEAAGFPKELDSADKGRNNEQQGL